MRTSSDQTLEEIIAQAAVAAKPPEALTVSEAAAKYRHLNNPGNYVGPWRNEKTPYLVEPMDELTSTDFTGLVFAGSAQSGKPLDVATPILTPAGWTTMGDLRVGDYVFDHHGQPTRVIYATDVMRGHECFDVIFDDGSVIRADAEHRWAVLPVMSAEPDVLVERTTRQMLSEGWGSSGKYRRSRYAVPLAAPIEFPEADLPVAPYLLGLWLAEGRVGTSSLVLNIGDADEIMSRVGDEECTYYPRKGNSAGTVDRVNFTGLIHGLRALGCDTEKHVPEVYLRASIEQRRDLVRGLFDGDATSGHRGVIEFSTSVPRLAETVFDLLIGLGHKVSTTSRIPKCRGKAGKRNWRLTFTPVNAADVFSLKRQIETRRAQLASGKVRERHITSRFIRDIVPVESVPVRCIHVESGDHLFLAGRNLVPTHNTDMFLNYLLYSALVDPADLMLIQTSKVTARDFSIRRVDRLHRHTPVMRDLVVARRDADNVFDKHYKAGMMLTLSWPSINELSGRPIPRLWLTDYDRMDMNVDGEGSPFDLARTRAKTFRSYGMCVAESSPGKVIDNPKWRPTTRHEAPPTEGILALYNRGDRRRYYWRCANPSCRLAFEPDFSLIDYPDSRDFVEAAEAATLKCPHCGFTHYHDGGGSPSKDEMNLGGRWIKDGQVWLPSGEIAGTARRSDIASFWMKGVIAAFADWKGLVLNQLNAQHEYENTGSEEALKTTANTDRGEPYLPKSLETNRSAQELMARERNHAPELGMVPPNVRFLIAAIDIQKNRFEVQVHGIAENGDIYVIDRFPIKYSRRRDPERPTQFLWVNPGAHPEDWKLLVDQVILKTYPLADDSGRRMAIHMTVSDSGGKDGTTANAYKFYRWLLHPETWLEDGQDPGSAESVYAWEPGLASRFRLLKGASTPNAPRVRVEYPDSGRKDRNAGARGEIPVAMINTNTIKDDLNNRLERTTPGGAIMFQKGLGENFYTELTVEVKDSKGRWTNPRQYRNESWDLLVYTIVATLLPEVGFERIQFTDPPSWAERWDDNSLVFRPSEKAKPFDSARDPEYRIDDLAEQLA